MDELATRHRVSPKKSDPGVVLAVDTSSARGSLALLREGQTIGAGVLDSGQPHSRTLFHRLGEVLGGAGVRLEQVGLFAVVTGPGSFTGLRVGMSAMLGLARAEGKTLLGVTAFDAWALASGEIGKLAVLIDAGRSHVYYGERRVTPEGRVTGESPDLMCDRRDTGALLTRQTDSSARLVIGDITSEEQETFLNAGWRTWLGPADLANAAGRLAWRRWHDGDQSPPVPYYFRPSDAEIKAGGQGSD